MTENLLSAVKGFITPDFLTKASEILGESTERSKLSFFSAIPALLKGLMEKGSTPEGAHHLINLVREDGYEAGVPSHYQDFLKGGKTTDLFMQKGEDALKGIFGDQLGFVSKTLSEITGTSSSICQKILSLVAPLAMGTLGSVVKEKGLNASSLMGFLNQQKAFLPQIPVSKTSPPEEEEPREELREIHPQEALKIREKKEPGRWVPFGIAVLALCAFFLFKGRKTEVPVPPSEIRERAGVAGQSPGPGVVHPPEAIEEVSTFLDQGSDAELPKRFGFENLNFKFGTAELTPNSLTTVDDIATLLKSHPDAVVQLEGFTDNIGSPEANEKLSLARAESVKQSLIERGVDGNRIATRAGGESHPVAPNTTDTGRQENRRLELVIIQR